MPLSRESQMLCFGMIQYVATLPHKQPSHDHCQTSKSTRHQILTGRRVTPVPSWPLLLFTLTFIAGAKMEATKRWSPFRPFTTPPLLLPVPVRAILNTCFYGRHLGKQQSSLPINDFLNSDDFPAWVPDRGWWPPCCCLKITASLSSFLLWTRCLHLVMFRDLRQGAFGCKSQYVRRWAAWRRSALLVWWWNLWIDDSLVSWAFWDSW